MEKVTAVVEKDSGMGESKINEKLGQAGMTEERYAMIKAALVLARRESGNPEEPEKSRSELDPIIDALEKHMGGY